jgi:hypothetical protein
MTTATFAVSHEHIEQQFADGSCTDISGEHLLWLDPEMKVLTTTMFASAALTGLYLGTGVWAAPVHLTCMQEGCILPAHLTSSNEASAQAQDHQVFAMTQRASTSLADLYRKGRASGLLKPRTSYPHN